MKKLLAFLLVLVMILSVSLVACNKQQAASDNDDDDDWGNGNEATDDNDNTDNNGTNDNNDDPVPSGSLTWDPRDDKIYVAQNTYLRASATLNDTTRIVVTMGEELSRKGTATNGDWDKVEYAGETYYIMKYVTVTNKSSVIFNNLDEQIETTVINEFTNGEESQYTLRTSPCYKKAYQTQLNQLNWGAAVKKSDGNLKVLALSLDETWARVEYKGEKYYVQTYCLEAFADNSGGSGSIPDGPIA